MKKIWRCIAELGKLSLIGVFLLSPLLMAQTTTGSVYGTVADSTGAIIPDVVVTVTNIGTGREQTAKTNSSGEYVFTSLNPGNYTVSTAAPGFKTVTQRGLVLSANQNVHANFALQTGATTESVTVDAGITLVDTRESQLGETIDQRRIEELPLNGRNAYDLATIVPGVTSYNGDTAIGSRLGVNFSVNGLPVKDVSYYLDGAYNDSFFQNGGNLIPNPDALQEFRLLTSNFDAEFGRSPGGVMNIITKSGTQKFHGMVYDYLRNDALNAKNYFLNDVTPLKQNQFGANVGGPLLPHGRAFFFLSYEGLRIHTPDNVSGTALVTATALERNGDFSKSKDAKGNPVVLKNTSCNGVANVICPSSLDPVAQAMLKLVPVYDAVAKSTVQQTASANQTANQGLARIDFELTPKHQIEMMFFNSRGNSATPTITGNQILDYSGMQNYENIVNAVLADTWAISPNTLNNLRGFYTQNRSIISNLYDNHHWADFGSQVAEGGPISSPPRIAITGYWNMGTNQAGPNDQSQLSFGAIDTMNLTRGHHNMKAGGAFVWNKYAADGGKRAGGIAMFTGSATGNALADFLEGKANSLLQTDAIGNRQHQPDPSLFFQDDWQATKRLSLNLGLRWEVLPPYTGGDITNGTFAAGMQSKVFPTAPVGLLYEGDAGISKGIYHTSYTNFAPRVGFAYDVYGEGKTSLRGGFGIFYEVQTPGLANALVQQPFGLQVTVNKTPNLVTPYAPNADPFPYIFDPANPKFTSGATIAGVRGGSLPYVEEYNLTVEQQLGAQWAARIAYVGNAGRKFYILHDINAPRYSPGASTTTAGINARRPYEPTPTTFTYGAIQPYDNANNSGYNSLQTTIRGRIGSKFNLLASYVWSKDIDYNIPFVDGADISKNRGLSDQDIRHRFVASYLYKLPEVKIWGLFGKEVLSGWQLNVLTVLSSGSPFTVTSGIDTNLDGTNNDRPDLIGDPYFHGSRSRAQKIAQYFNPDAFDTPTAPYGNVRRNALIGPANVNTNMSAFKMFPIYNDVRLQFRAEMFNAFGNVNLNTPASALSSPNAGVISSAGDPRIVQFALKVLF